MTLAGTGSIAEAWAALSTEEREIVLSQIPVEDAARILYDWETWARPDQLLPDGNWTVWSLISGRGAGKTRTGAETIKQWVGGPNNPPIRIALVAESAADARDVMVEGESGLLAISPPWNMPVYAPSKRRLTWPNGSIAIHFSGDKPDQLRGPQFHKAWVDEIAKFQYAQDCWDNLEMGLRLGSNPQAIVTTTPRPLPLLRDMLADPMTVVTRVSTYANIGNLAQKYIQRVIKRYEGTRLGRQELHAEILSDTPGALWTYDMIEANRVMASPRMRRIVVGVDPSINSGDDEGANDAGIVVCGKGAEDGKGYVMRDASINGTPLQWARKAILMYDEFGASRVIAEKNQGGEMVRTVLHSLRPDLPVKLVTASLSKEARAEPISVLMEQGRIKHVGGFATLEDQMCMTTTDGYQGAGSPDRMDAMVHAMKELMYGSQVSYDPAAYEDYVR